MAKGGRYLKKEEKKKGRGWKIALVIVLVLAVVVGFVVKYFLDAYNEIIEGVNFAVIETKEVSEEDIQNILNYNPDKPDDWDEQQATATAEDATEETAADTAVEDTAAETAAQE